MAVRAAMLRRLIPSAALRFQQVPRALMSGGSTKLWGGRFTKDIDQSIHAWADSCPIDRKMVTEDTWGSIAHVSMLARQSVIPLEDAKQIIAALLRTQDDWQAGKWDLMESREDVHLNVEGRLIDELGVDIAGKMHTTRSRNDQVPLDSRLMTRRDLLTLRDRTAKAINAFLERAEDGAEDVMVLYTHVQHAQPATVGFWLSHYASVMLRDMDRLKEAYDCTDMNPLGAGAIAGTSFNIDRQLTTKLLGFQSCLENGLDATGTRDFFLQVLSSAATLTTTTSRLAEEFILWSSYEFRSLTLDDGFAMGSSMMPQKKNPGALELMRGRQGRMLGYLTAGMTMMKGLPSGYNRDFHEEKEIIFRSLEIANGALDVVPALVRSTTINKERMLELTHKNFACATELANFLVRKGMAFRTAHHVVGSLVGELTRAGDNFANLDFCLAHLQKSGVECTMADVKGALDPVEVVNSYNTFGGTSPASVRANIKNLREKLANHEATLAQDNARVSNAYTGCRGIATDIGTVNSIADLDALINKHFKI